MKCSYFHQLPQQTSNFSILCGELCPKRSPSLCFDPKCAYFCDTCFGRGFLTCIRRGYLIIKYYVLHYGAGLWQYVFYVYLVCFSMSFTFVLPAWSCILQFCILTCQNPTTVYEFHQGLSRGILWIRKWFGNGRRKKDHHLSLRNRYGNEF